MVILGLEVEIQQSPSNLNPLENFETLSTLEETLIMRLNQGDSTMESAIFSQ